MARSSLPLAVAGALAASLAFAGDAHADENRRGLQLEAMVGGAACIPGRVPCSRTEMILDGRTLPSFGTGAALGIRPFRWFMFGGMYRWGMFNPDYQTTDGTDYRWGGQHTVAFFMRPILPVWRFDLGLNLAPGYGRQVFRRDAGTDRDYSQGFSFLMGPTVDVFLTERFFLGAEVDFIFNTQKKVCRVRGGGTDCTENPDMPSLTPTNQTIFGLHFGGTFL